MIAPFSLARKKRHSNRFNPLFSSYGRSTGPLAALERAGGLPYGSIAGRLALERATERELIPQNTRNNQLKPEDATAVAAMAAAAAAMAATSLPSTPSRIPHSSFSAPPPAPNSPCPFFPQPPPAPHQLEWPALAGDSGSSSPAPPHAYGTADQPPADCQRPSPLQTVLTVGGDSPATPQPTSSNDPPTPPDPYPQLPCSHAPNLASPPKAQLTRAFFKAHPMRFASFGGIL